MIAHGLTSPMLEKMGERELVDELRVIISDTNGVTAYFTFSSGMRPSLHQFRIYGPTNGLLLDQDNETMIRLRGRRYKSYAEHFLSPLVMAKQYAGNSARNVRSFVVNDFHMKSGLKYLIEAFYRSIAQGAPLPIPYREILLTARIMVRSSSRQDARGPPSNLREARGRGNLGLEGMRENLRRLWENVGYPFL